MPINQVTYYEVECDKCREKTGDLGGDFSAYSTSLAAADDWGNSEGVITNGGDVYCRDCVPVGYCPEADNEAHEFVTDEAIGGPICKHCDFEPPAENGEDQ